MVVRVEKLMHLKRYEIISEKIEEFSQQYNVDDVLLKFINLV